MASLRFFLFILLSVIVIAATMVAAAPPQHAAAPPQHAAKSRSLISGNAVRQDGDDDDNDDDDGDDDDPTASPEDDDEVCVDAKHLAHYPSHLLVHLTPFRASVLCPLSSTLPCATADHMLRVEGKSMSYREYCSIVKCSKDEMDVNSVMSHVWKETAHDNGRAMLTMYDARHPESLQRMVHRVTALRRTVSRVFS